jgi:hypothetical protein
MVDLAVFIDHEIRLREGMSVNPMHTGTVSSLRLRHVGYANPTYTYPLSHFSSHINFASTKKEQWCSSLPSCGGVYR